MAEEKTTTITVGGRSAEVPIDSHGNVQTVKYLGTDMHSKAVLEGRFGSNVGPRKSGWRKPLTEDWVCPHCNYLNRPYMIRCWNDECGVYR